MATGPAHPDKTDTAAEAGGGEGSATYSVFQTSIAKLRMARWRVTPDWKSKSRDEARDFLRAAPVRDKRTLSEKGLFRMLFVHLPDANQLTLHEDLIEVARNHAWIDSQFASRLRSPSGGMVWLDSRESANMGLVVQAPATAGDGLAYCFSLTNIRGFESDWVCLFVGARDVCPQRVASLMSQDPFPSDFVLPLPPDFMFLPICVLSYDISELAKSVDEVNSGVLHIVGQLTEAGIPEAGVPTEIGGSDAAVGLLSEHVGYLHEPTDMCRIRAGRAGLLKIQQKHLALKRRWSFLHEFAHKLGSYFELRVASWSKEGDPATYSAALRGRVDRELANLDSLFHELDVIPLRIEAQQSSVDSYMSLIIAKNSQIIATASLAEGRVMRTIAIVTFVFLPGTFVAAVFSMSIFDWKADEAAGQTLVSKYIWVYALITVLLTSLVMLSWAVWMRRAKGPPGDVEMGLR